MTVYSLKELKRWHQDLDKEIRNLEIRAVRIYAAKHGANLSDVYRKNLARLDKLLTDEGKPMTESQAIDHYTAIECMLDRFKMMIAVNELPNIIDRILSEG